MTIANFKLTTFLISFAVLDLSHARIEGEFERPFAILVGLKNVKSFAYLQATTEDDSEDDYTSHGSKLIKMTTLINGLVQKSENWVCK